MICRVAIVKRVNVRQKNGLFAQKSASLSTFVTSKKLGKHALTFSRRPILKLTN